MSYTKRKKGFGNSSRLLLLTIFLLCIATISLYPTNFISKFASTFFKLYSFLFRQIIGYFPFSFSEFIYLILIICIPIIIYKHIQKQNKQVTSRSWKNYTFIPLCWLLGLFIYYQFIWGFNYQKPSIGYTLELKKDSLTQDKLISLATYIISKTNSLSKHSHKLNHLDFNNLRQETLINYKNLERKYPQFKYKGVSIKKMLLPELWTNLGIEGYYNPVTAEANINQNIVPWVKPFVLSHEVAHQFGIAYEDEANLLGYIATITNEKPEIKYSAYYAMLRYILIEIAYNKPEKYTKTYALLNKTTQTHFAQETEFWKEYNAQMSMFMNLTFDTFLKLNKQETGIKSYSQIIYWLWDIHKDEIESNQSQNSAIL